MSVDFVVLVDPKTVEIDHEGNVIVHGHDNLREIMQPQRQPHLHNALRSGWHVFMLPRSLCQRIARWHHAAWVHIRPLHVPPNKLLKRNGCPH